MINGVALLHNGTGNKGVAFSLILLKCLFIFNSAVIQKLVT